MARQRGEATVIVGVGLDLVGVERMGAMLTRHGTRLLARCFTAGEVARPADAEHIAGLLAAKEATFKALGTGWGDGVGWRDVAIARSVAGAPSLLFAGAAAARAAVLGVRTAHLSITHAAGVAVAVVILET